MKYEIPENLREIFDRANKSVREMKRLMNDKADLETL